VRVGAPHHAELEGVDAQLLLLLQTHLEGAAGVLVLEHPIFLGLEAGDVGLVPGAVIGPLVVWRQRGVGLAVTLDLGDLVDRLPPHAGLRIFAVDGLTVQSLD
jgi:hypothetical protein